MSLLLDTIRAERDKLLAPLRDRLAQLDELERLAEAFDGDGEGAGPPDSPPQDAGALPAAAETQTAETKRTRTRTGGRRHAGRNGGNAPAQAGARAGSAPSGAGSAPRQRAAVRPGPAGVRWALEQRSPLTAAQIAELVGLAAGTVTNTVAHMLAKGDLVDAGFTERPGGPGGRPPRVVALPAIDDRDRRERDRPHGPVNGINGRLPELKARVLDAINADPAALNEDRLALVLNVDREDIAVATGELLVYDHVILLPDGTYRPALPVAA